jgi:protoporphyrin/coproporphyrin ferrochelatase
MSIGVLVMAYGGPDTLDDVEPYLLDVRGGRATSHEIVEEVRERYRQIGGRSPILEQTREQAAVLQRALDQTRPGTFRTYVGMRHWHPFIHAVVDEMRAAGLARIIGVVMAPHYSDMSIGAYERKLRKSAEGMPVLMIRSWALLPGYLDAVAANVKRALQSIDADVDTRVLFTAHSLPQRILEADDPYQNELLLTMTALRQRLPDVSCDFAYQSAAMTTEPWLGPDAGEVLTEWSTQGVRKVVVCAIGFVTEHVEILYDLDIELQKTAAQLGVQLVRAPMVGADEGTMTGVAKLIASCASAEGWLDA